MGIWAFGHLGIWWERSLSLYDSERGSKTAGIHVSQPMTHSVD